MPQLAPKLLLSPKLFPRQHAFGVIGTEELNLGQISDKLELFDQSRGHICENVLLRPETGTYKLLLFMYRKQST